MTDTLAVDDLTFQVRRSTRRKTIEIVIGREGSLVVAAPTGADLETLDAFVREKRGWIYSRLAHREALQHPVVTKEFVTGEGFSYLGRSYRLLLVNNQDVPLKLEAGRFRMRRRDVGRGRQVMIDWYTKQARAWLQERVERFRQRLDVNPSSLSVRDLGYRWGSCGKGGKLYFHWRCILLPARIADYVVVHELVHLRESSHSAAFWKRMRAAMPDFEARKQWLAENGARLLF